jgi:hypothetical protein
MLPDISKYENVYDIPLLFFAILMVNVFIIFFTRFFPNTVGIALNEWYTKFKMTALLSDVLLILLGFIVARYVYTTWITPRYGWNIWIFLAVLVAVRMLHDMILYVAVILPIPIGHNEMIDVVKQYSKGGPKNIVSDAFVMIASALLACYYKSEPVHVVVTASVLALYNAIYMIYTKPL